MVLVVATTATRRGRASLAKMLLLLVVVGVTATTTSALECIDPQTGQVIAKITPQQVNDNYCDCPFTGIDEPGTSACAGSHFWPGSVGLEDGQDVAG